LGLEKKDSPIVLKRLGDTPKKKSFWKILRLSDIGANVFLLVTCELVWLVQAQTNFVKSLMDA
jgi:hypothetical protein